MAHASDLQSPPIAVSVAVIFAALAATVARRADDVSFLEWIVGAGFVVVFASPFLGAIDMAGLLEGGALWAGVGALLVTRSNAALVRAVERFVVGKYGEARIHA